MPGGQGHFQLASLVQPDRARACVGGSQTDTRGPPMKPVDAQNLPVPHHARSHPERRRRSRCEREYIARGRH